MDLNLESWTKEYILDLLTKGVFECDYFDFKEKLPDSRNQNEKERITTACGSFANSDGGFLIFGVKDDRSLPPIDRLSGMDPAVDFPALFGAYPQKCEPSIQWAFKNPAIELPNGNVINIAFIPKSLRAPHSVGNANDGLRFPKRTNKGVEYMAPNEIKNSYLGYYEKRLKVQLLFAEIGNLASDAKLMMIPESDQITQYPFIQFNLSVIETVYPEIFTLISEDTDLVGRMMALRNLCKTTNSKIVHFLSQAALPMSNTHGRIKAHNKYITDASWKVINEASEIMKLLKDYRI